MKRNKNQIERKMNILSKSFVSWTKWKIILFCCNFSAAAFCFFRFYWDDDDDDDDDDDNYDDADNNNDDDADNNNHDEADNGNDKWLLFSQQKKQKVRWLCWKQLSLNSRHRWEPTRLSKFSQIPIEIK